MTTDLLKLVQWLSPAFPIGAYAYSHGLEAAIDAGEVRDTAGLEIWLRGVLRHGAGWQDAVLLVLALRGDDAKELAAFARAAAPSAERWQETRDLGAAFAACVRAIGVDVPDTPMPVAVGMAARGLDLPPDQIVAQYLHSFIANLVSAAVRFVPLGQSEGAQVLDRLHGPIVAMAGRAVAARSLDDATSGALAADLAAMRHETMDVRIFRT